jgi:hypothetical protein
MNNKITTTFGSKKGATGYKPSPFTVNAQQLIPFLNQDEHAKASEQRQGSTMSTVRSGTAQPTK